MTPNDSNNNDFNQGIESITLHKNLLTTPCADAAAGANVEKVEQLECEVIVREPLMDFINDLTEPRRRRVWRVPWFLLIMSTVQFIIYCVDNECLHQHLIFSPDTRQHFYSYLTYMLLHSDLVHLLLNISLQSTVGIWLECEQGHWRLAFIYFAGGISGSLVTGIFRPHLSILGASAGVYAMLTSHGPHMCMNFRLLPYRYSRVVALAILCLSDMGFTAYHYAVNRNANPRICVEAHMAGALAGVAFGFLIYRKHKRKETAHKASETRA